MASVRGGPPLGSSRCEWLTTLAGIVFYTKSDKVKMTIELTDVDLSDKSLSFFLV